MTDHSVLTQIKRLYLSEKEVAALLGRSVTWLRQNRTDLELTCGFPPIDPVLKKTHSETLEAWAKKRAERLSGAVEQVSRQTSRGNRNAF